MKKIFLGLSSLLFVVGDLIGMRRMRTDSIVYSQHGEPGLIVTPEAKKVRYDTPYQLATKNEMGEEMHILKTENLSLIFPKETKGIKLIYQSSTKNKIGKKMHILRKDDLLTISPEEAKGIESMTFKGVKIGVEFWEHWRSIAPNLDSVDEIVFLNCELSEGITYYNILDGGSISKLSIIDSDISISDLSNSLLLIDPYRIKQLKIARNTFDEAALEAVLNERVFGVLRLNRLDLRENKLSDGFKEYLRKKEAETGMGLLIP